MRMQPYLLLQMSLVPGFRVRVPDVTPRLFTKYLVPAIVKLPGLIPVYGSRNVPLPVICAVSAGTNRQASIINRKVLFMTAI